MFLFLIRRLPIGLIFIRLELLRYLFATRVLRILDFADSEA